MKIEQKRVRVRVEVEKWYVHTPKQFIELVQMKCFLIPILEKDICKSPQNRTCWEYSYINSKKSLIKTSILLFINQITVNF